MAANTPKSDGPTSLTRLQHRRINGLAVNDQLRRVFRAVFVIAIVSYMAMPFGQARHSLSNDSIDQLITVLFGVFAVSGLLWLLYSSKAAQGKCITRLIRTGVHSTCPQCDRDIANSPRYCDVCDWPLKGWREKRMWHRSERHQRNGRAARALLLLWLVCIVVMISEQMFGYLPTTVREETPANAVLSMMPWLLFLLAGMEIGAFATSVDRLLSLSVRDHCPVCKYDIRATPDHCPECGWGDARNVKTDV